ncbi:MAG: hypothetical protein WC697_03050 [Patescibacteria group bacterium]|jgi:hypothetical protein
MGDIENCWGIIQLPEQVTVIIRIDVESRSLVGVKFTAAQVILTFVEKSKNLRRFETLPKAIQSMSDLTGEDIKDVEEKYRKYF